MAAVKPRSSEAYPLQASDKSPEEFGLERYRCSRIFKKSDSPSSNSQCHQEKCPPLSTSNTAYVVLRWTIWPKNTHSNGLQTVLANSLLLSFTLIKSSRPSGVSKFLPVEPELIWTNELQQVPKKLRSCVHLPCNMSTTPSLGCKTI